MKLTRPSEVRAQSIDDLPADAVAHVECIITPPWGPTDYQRHVSMASGSAAYALQAAYADIGWVVSVENLSDQRDGPWYRLTFERPRLT